MSTKTYANNPTANLFELLQVDNDLPEKRTGPNKNTQAARKPGDAPVERETPAEKAQRRKADQAQKAAAAAAEKQRKEAEDLMAAAIPQEGFQVQKGSAQKKPSEAKPKALNREDFETRDPQDTKPKQPRGPGNPKKNDGSGKPGFDGAQKPRYTDDKRPYNQQQTGNRPPRHEGFDKQSGGKTSNKAPPRKKGDGQFGWGNDASTQSQAQQDWGDNVISTPSGNDGPGWGDDAPTSSAPADEKKPEKTENKDDGEKGDKSPENKKIAWDEEEGHGKILLDEFQKTVAAEREKKLADLKVGVKGPGRQIEQTVDLSKCSYRETTDEKEKRFAEERKKQLAEERKKKGQQRAGEKNVDLSTYIDVRTRGGRGGRGGGRGGDRPPRTEGQASPAQEGSQSPAPERPNRGGRGGGGRGNKVPQNKGAFPDLPSVATPAPAAVKAVTATPPATGSPKSTK